MRCSSCNADNPQGLKFCEQCGAPFKRRCAQCGFENSPAARFCGSCGASLETATPPPAATPEPSSTSPEPVPAGERRQLTVLFCDLVGSTNFSRQLDAEEWRDILAKYQQTASDAVARWGGYVAKNLGDGLLIYFGWPTAHEDAPERAIRAGLAILEGIAPLNAELAAADGIRLAVRIGMHTGPVVIADGGEVFGDTPNVAARVQSAAEPDMVFITAATQRLVPGLFVVEDRGPHELKGIREPMTLYRVVQPSGVRGRLEAAATLSSLVGRDPELGILADRWERAREGRGQAVLISGEAGVGKSRLVRAFGEKIAGEPHTWLHVACSAYGGPSPFRPIIEIYTRGLGFVAGESDAERWARLEAACSLPGLDAARVAPYIGDMLGMRPSERFPLPEMSSQLLRERTLDALVSVLIGLSALQPIVLVFEDLHWSDPSTIAAVARIMDGITTAPVLLLLTARPEFQTEWGSARSHLSQISLVGLTARQAGALVSAVIGRLVFPDAVMRAIVERSGGIPLFLEELSRSVMESGLLAEEGGHLAMRDRMSDVAVPATLRDTLMARLDRLGSAKQIAQVCATLGREFEYELLEAVAATDVPTLRAALNQLVAAEILYKRGDLPVASFIFKHSLIQETAYESLLRATRRLQHGRIASVLKERFPAVAQKSPEVMGHHCAEAGLVNEAIEHFQNAGGAAAGRAANDEASSYYSRALDLLAQSPEGAERHHREVTLRIGLGEAMAGIGGYLSPEIRANYARVRALADLLGEGPQQLPALIGLVSYYVPSSNFPELLAVGRAIFALGESLNVLPIRTVGQVLVATATTTRTNLAERHAALRMVEEAIVLAESGALPPPMSRNDPDLEVAARTLYAMLLNIDGAFDRAWIAMQRAIERARALNHPFSLCHALIMASAFGAVIGDPEIVAGLVDEVLQITRERGFQSFESQAMVYRGWIMAAASPQDAVKQVNAGLSLFYRVGMRNVTGWLEMIAGEAMLIAGSLGEARIHLDHSAAALTETGEDAMRPNLQTRLGDLLVAENRLAEAEQVYLAALDFARENQLFSGELRAGLALGKLLCSRNRADQAAVILRDLLNRCEEGFDRPPVRTMRELIAEIDTGVGRRQA